MEAMALDTERFLNPEETALLAGEQRVLEWLLQRGRPSAAAGAPAGRWIEAYMTAGRAALAKEIPLENWVYLRLELKPTANARRILHKLLYPTLMSLSKKGVIQRFWYLVKHDPYRHVRLRLFGATEPLRQEALGAVMRALKPGAPRSPVTICRELVYEPETALFGGEWALDQVHELFWYDSRFAMGWLGTEPEETANLSAHQVSVIALQHLFRASGLDGFEQWDVWQKVVKVRPGNEAALEEAWESYKENMRLLVGVQPMTIANAMAEETKLMLVDYVNGLTLVGEHLWEGLKEGKLQRGLRHVLATAVVFHWNRMLFAGSEQIMLAHFMARAVAPMQED
jgi:protein-L-isoaspartate(D-aspartate) O-methyltransferase